MKAVDQIVSLEINYIQKIIADETWLEGERRGQPVDSQDPVVIESVCGVVMRIGAELRASLTNNSTDQNLPLQDCGQRPAASSVNNDPRSLG